MSREEIERHVSRPIIGLSSECPDANRSQNLRPKCRHNRISYMLFPARRDKLTTHGGRRLQH